MSRLVIIFFVLLMPFQFAWSAASAYCQHETSEPQSQHFGHHFHVHKGEPKASSASQLTADSDCVACHAAGAAVISSGLDGRDFAVAAQFAKPAAPPPFTSVLARAPDRPQWLRLV